MSGELDLIIAGGGPAGLATALYARRAGLDVLVVEPRAAPLDKACGEGLLPPAVAALDDLLAGYGSRPPGATLRGIRYLSATARAEARFRDGTGLGVRRTALHAALSAAAHAAGVTVVPGRVDGVEQDRDGVSVGAWRARYLVAADGLHSPVRAALGLAGAPTAGSRRRWGVRAHFPVSPWTDFVEVHWSHGSEAYVTPLGPDCVGVAILGPRGESFAVRLTAFPELLGRLGGAQPGPVLGAGPLRQAVRRRVQGRVLLVGDAAGYVDALTGEGLAVAFESARALIARIEQGRPDRYEHDYRAISRRYRLLTSALLRLAGSPPLRRRLVPAAARFPSVFAAGVDQVASRPATARLRGEA